MTRKQEIEEMAKTTASHITSDKDMQVAFADALRRGAEWADRTMIDKACSWLLEWETHQGEDIEVVEQFRKAMEGE